MVSLMEFLEKIQGTIHKKVSGPAFALIDELESWTKSAGLCFYASMNFVWILTIALALALDAFAVSVAAGVCLPEVGARRTLRLAWHFGFFQAGMTILGWAAALTVRQWIESLDHWLAFGFLAFIGVRMIVGAVKEAEDDAPFCDPTKGPTMVILSVATSLDALAVGISFSMLKISVWFPALAIGVVAAVMTAMGLHFGRIAGSASRLGRWAEGFGGLVLVAIGIKILHEHGVF